MRDVVDVLFIFAKAILLIGFIDGVLLLLIWRIKVLNRNVDRRASNPIDPTDQKQRDDKIFEEVDRFYGAPW